MKIDGVVFDLDATLVNLGGFVDWKRARMRAVETYLECGCSEDVLDGLRGVNLFDMLNRMWDELSGSLPRDRAQHVQDMVYAQISKCESEGAAQCQILPGCLESLDWLREHGIKMGIATSNSQEVAEAILKQNGLRDYFAFVVGREAGVRMKPNPDQILACFEKLGIDPHDGVVVGDSVKDVEAAKAAGACAIAVPSHFTSREALVRASADRIIESLCDLPNVILELDNTVGINDMRRGL